MIRYRAELSTPGQMIANPTVTEFFVQEQQGIGWIGSATVNTGPNRRSNVGGTFGFALNSGLVPGSEVTLKLIVDNDPQGYISVGTIVRTWPSVISNISSNTRNSPEGSFVDLEILFADPVSYLANSTLWAVITNSSPAMLVSKALSLVTGGDGEATLSPVIPNFPAINISEAVHESLAAIPYAIAHGEPLLRWLFFVLGRLGVRMEITGDSQGRLGIALKDLRPGGTPVDIRVNSGHETDTNHGAILSMRYASTANVRATLLDNPSTGNFRYIGSGGSVGAIIDSAYTDINQAVIKSAYQSQFSALTAGQMLMTTGQSGLTPGRLVNIINHENDVRQVWQVGDIRHVFLGGTYGNTFTTLLGTIPWRPPIPSREDRMAVVSGVVDSPDVEVDGTVNRDRLGRIPVKLSFTQPAEEATGNNQQIPSSSIDLPIIEQFAGGVHGFIPSHRQGDACRVVVRNPLFAEIAGFNYRDDFVAKEFLDTSAGWVVSHDQDQWSGMIFRSKDVDDELDESPD